MSYKASMPKILASGLLERVFHFENPIPDQDASPPLMQFTDRIFLANYLVDAIAAALPAGIASFMGVANYTNVFVAQYTGARAFMQVGSTLWQGICFSLFAAVLPGANHLFRCAFRRALMVSSPDQGICALPSANVYVYIIKLPELTYKGLTYHNPTPMPAVHKALQR